jgi:phosphate transport system substrate-binding protein
LWLLGPLLAATGCSSQPAPTRNLVITGSYAMAPVIRDIAQRFEAAHPGVRVDVQGVGSPRGVSDAQQGLADIGLVGRWLGPGESGLNSVLFARDGIAVVVPRSSSVKSLTEGQIVGIFTRTIPNWKQVGGSDSPITVIGMPDPRSLPQVFLQFYKLKVGQVRSDVVAPDTAEVLAILGRKADAIGYVSVAAATGNVTEVRLLPCNGIEPTPANIASGTYPLLRPYLLVTRDKPHGLTEEFIAYARSDAVRDLLDKYHLVRPAN